MLLSIPGSDFESAEQRRSFAKYLSGVVQGGLSSRFEPYLPNTSDDRCFVIDSDNDWRVSFPEEDPSSVDISYRYQVQAEEALVGWLAFLVRATISNRGGGNAEKTQHERHRGIVRNAV